MSGFELNKIIAGILVASIIAVLVGMVADVLYKPELQAKNRGYTIATHSQNIVQSAEAVQDNVDIDIKQLISVANADAGKDVIKKCLSCHSFDKGGANKVGPNLWNIVGHPKAKVQGYNYSPALISKGGNWDEESLFKFLQKPSKYAPGTKMSFAGISKPEDIANLIAFLKKFAQE
jgi:cytochrome c